MMVVDIRTQKGSICKVEVVLTRHVRGGKSRYRVVAIRGEARLEFEVEHRRQDGAFKLAEKACRKAAKLMDEYYSYPEDKVEHGFIRGSNIPRRYRREFGKFFGVGTVTALPKRPCPEGCVDLDFRKKDEIAYNIGDLEGFLENRRFGAVPMWD